MSKTPNADWLWVGALVSATLLVNVLYWAGVASPARTAVSAFYFFFAPGMALIRPLHLQNRVVELFSGVALSISVTMIVSEILVYGGNWDVLAGLRGLSVIVLTGCAIQLIQITGRPDGAAAQAPNSDKPGEAPRR
jgi:uncharacterized membrane protein